MLLPSLGSDPAANRESLTLELHEISFAFLLTNDFFYFGNVTPKAEL